MAQVGGSAPKDSVLAGFRVDSGTPEQLGAAWGFGFRCGQTVLRRVMEPDIALFSAHVRSVIQPVNVGLARPLRSSDGRFMLNGWRADTYLAGRPMARFDETIAAHLRVGQALAGVEMSTIPNRSAVHQILRMTDGVPPTPWTPAQMFRVAQQAAFAQSPADVIAPGLDPGQVADESTTRCLQLAAEVAGMRQEIASPDQLVTGDPLGTTIYDRTNSAVVTDLVPTLRPAAWPAALAVVDGLSWGNADDGLLKRWAHLPDFGQLCVRALLYRLFVHALHPQATPEAIDGLARTAQLIKLLVSPTVRESD